MAVGTAPAVRMTEMLEKPIKGEERTKADPRLAEVVRIIVEQFGGDVQAYLESIRPKLPETKESEPEEGGRLAEAASRCL